MGRPACLVFVFALAACSGKDNEPAETPGDSATDGSDAVVDSSKKDGSSDSTTKPPGDSTVDTFEPFDTTPTPVTDLGTEDFGTLPSAGMHAEALIGPSGGTVKGKPGSELDQVMLVVPAGALSVSTTIALDLALAPPMPPGAKAGGIYVKVGPDGTAFAVPARLTLPWLEPGASPQVMMLARVGTNWSSLLDPTGDSKTLTASMTRASGAMSAILSLTGVVPKPTAFAPTSAAVGSTVFLDGSGFSIAPVWRPGADGGAPFASSISVGGVAATPLAWSDTTISFRVPTGATTGTISVTTPGGVGTTTGTLTIP